MHKVDALLPERLHRLRAQFCQLFALCGAGLRRIIAALTVQPQTGSFFPQGDRHAASADRYRLTFQPESMHAAHFQQKPRCFRLPGLQLNAVFHSPEDACICKCHFLFLCPQLRQKHSVLILVKPRHLVCALLELLKQFVRKFLLFRWKFLQKSIVHFQHRNFCRYPALPVFQHRTLIRCKQLCRCILIDQQIIAQAVIRLLRQLLLRRRQRFCQRVRLRQLQLHSPRSLGCIGGGFRSLIQQPYGDGLFLLSKIQRTNHAFSVVSQRRKIRHHPIKSIALRERSFFCFILPLLSRTAPRAATRYALPRRESRCGRSRR